MRSLAVAGLAMLVGIVVLAIALNTDRSATTCAPANGGDDGVEAQLRYIEVNDRSVTFTFGPSALSSRFGVPRFSVDVLDGPTEVVHPDLDTGTRRLRVSFAGASGWNPDLTPSYYGNSVRVPPIGGLLREARVLQDTERHLAWAVVLERLACPRITTNTYVWGKSPRAQVSLSFTDDPWITAEWASSYVGAPILGPVKIAGMGFEAEATVTLRLAGSEVGTGTTDASGRLEASFVVPKRSPGIYMLTAKTAWGREARIWLTVTDER